MTATAGNVGLDVVSAVNTRYTRTHKIKQLGKFLEKGSSHFLSTASSFHCMRCSSGQSLTYLCNIAFASGRQSHHDDTYFCILDLDADTVSFPWHGEGSLLDNGSLEKR